MSYYRRSDFEVKLDVLRVLGLSEEIPTRIMARANLSWATLNRVSADMEKLSLIMIVPITPRSRRGRKRHRIYLTDKGLQALEHLKALLLMISPKGIADIPQLTISRGINL